MPKAKTSPEATGQGRTARPTPTDIDGFANIIRWIQGHDDTSSLTLRTLDDALLSVRNDLIERQPRKPPSLESWLTLAIGETKSEQSPVASDEQKAAIPFFDHEDLNDVDRSVDIFLDSNSTLQVDHLTEFLSSVVDMLEAGDIAQATGDCEAVISGLFRRSTAYQQMLQLYKQYGSRTVDMLPKKGGDA